MATAISTSHFETVLKSRGDVHTEVLNAALLLRSSAKCSSWIYSCHWSMSGCRARDKGEMAAGRDSASLNEFIQLDNSPNSLWITSPPRQTRAHCLGPHENKNNSSSLLSLTRRRGATGPVLRLCEGRFLTVNGSGSALLYLYCPWPKQMCHQEAGFPQQGSSTADATVDPKEQHGHWR